MSEHNSMNETWLCLQTTTGREFKLSEHLQQLGVDAYAPRERKTYPRARLVYNPLKRTYDRVYQNCTSIFPFFPAYLFASPEYYERRLSVKLLPTSLKSRVIGTVDDDFIEAMRKREGDDGMIVTAKSRLDFGVGESVIVNTDSFQDVEAIFLEHFPERDRVKLLLMFLGTPREVTFDCPDVRVSRPAYA